ncbi:aspartic peptidase domain-containing protein [Suillus spraguei]|nr:aspartic peptidase domain-containing protein [Suillus spraguei]
MCLAASLSILSLALSITGSPVEVRNSLVTIPLTRRLNFSNGTIDFLQHDKARLAAFRGYNMHDRLFFDYRVQVGIGNPPTTYSLVLDTGSSITWVGTGKSYVRTGTSVNSERLIKVKYGHGQDTGTQSSFLGTIFYDTVTLGGGVTVTGFPLGVAFIWNGFDSGEDGIFGIGPEDLTRGTMPHDLEGTIPTFTDYLYKQRKIGRHVVGIFFQPVTTEPDSEIGTLTFGGTDRTKYVGTVLYTPITAMPPASRFWGINLSITYGSREILGFTAGIVDTGTTFLHIASDAYISYKAATGSTYDPPTGLLRITTRRYSALQNLEFHIEGQMFSLTPNAQIWPRSLNYKLDGGAPRAIYLIVIDSGMPSGRGDDFTVGHTFIQRFYTVFDRDNSLVGFAATPFSEAITN